MEQAAGGEVGERRRWAYRFCVDGDLRFISHHDTLRLFRRALARADIPVRFSQGFNPHPRISLPLPRPVGMASDAEILVIETEGEFDPEESLRLLDCHTPSDLSMVSVRSLNASEHLRPAAATYRFSEGDQGGLATDWRLVAATVEDVMNAASLETERRHAKSRQSCLVDIRPYIESIQTAPGTIEFTLRVTDNGTAKPAEVVALFGFEPSSVNHCIRRTAVQYK